MAAPFIVGAATGLANGIMNSAFNLINMENQSAVNKDLLAWQWKNFSSPAAQARSMAEAGISPAHAFGSGGSGYVAQPSVPSASIPSSQIGPVDFMQNLMLEEQRNLVKSEKEKNDADAENIRIKNITQLQQQRADLEKTLSEKDLSDEKRRETEKRIEEIDTNLETLGERNAAELNRQRAETRFTEAKERLTDAEIEYQSIVNQFEPVQRRALIQEIRAHSDELRSAAREHNAGALEKAANAALSKFNKYTQEKMLPILIDKANAEADYEAYKAGNEGKRYAYGRVGYELPVSDPKGDPWNDDLPNYNPRNRYKR